MKPSQSSTLIPLAPKASAQQLCCGLHKQDMDRQCQKQVSRVWLYFAVQKSFGAILRQTSLKLRLCQINTALQLGPLKKP